MPTYILLSTLTAEGRKTIKGKPDRIREVNKEIEAFGAKVVSQYAVLGSYDFVNVVEAPDNEAIARLSGAWIPRNSENHNSTSHTDRQLHRHGKEEIKG